MAEAFESLRVLISGGSKIDVPVPACLNHCINQEVFNCKVCGEIFDNIHKYITHGKGHRSSSCMCGWCGGLWPSYSALCIHQLVAETKKSKDASSSDGERGSEGSLSSVTCPLSCGVQDLSPTELRAHLLAFHGAQHEQINHTEKEGESGLSVSMGEDAVSCPRCETTVSGTQVGLENHLAFHCLSRSKAVKNKIFEIQTLSTLAGEEPMLVLLLEIEALILHLKGLLENGSYKERYLEEGLLSDKKYNRLPPAFFIEFLTWVPMGYNLQVLESEEENFPVLFDVWSQVVDKLAAPDILQDVSKRLEEELRRNLESGLTPRWASLNFDPAMFESPDLDVLSKLERELGWVR